MKLKKEFILAEKYSVKHYITQTSFCDIYF